MPTAGSRRPVAALAALVVVLAGCGGAVPFGGEPSTPAPAADPPPRGEAPHRSLSLDPVRASHRAALANRTNGTVTVRTQLVGGPGGIYGHLGSLSRSRIAERRTAYSLETGSQRRQRYGTDGSLVDDQFYPNASEGYTRFSIDGERYYGPATAHRTPSDLGAAADILRLLRFDGPTPVVWRDGPAYRYRASGLSAVRERYRANLSEGESDAWTNVTATVYVRPDGLVVHARSLVRTGTLEPDIRWNVTYTELGETTVTEPAWADDARSRLDRVSSVTTFERANESRGVAATVTGGWSNLTRTSYDFVPANGSLVEDHPIQFDRPDYVPDSGPVARHTVGRAVTVGVPADRRSATVTLQYDDTAVATDERYVAVAMVDADGIGIGVLAPNRTRVDARNDTVTAPLPPPSAFEGAALRSHRGTYVALDARALLEERVVVHVPGRSDETSLRLGANTTER